MDILGLFDPAPIYKAGVAVAQVVAGILTPVLLVSSIAFRAVEEQLNVLSGEGKYSRMLRDFLVYGFIIGSYFAVMNVIAGFMNPVYAWIDSFGSMQVVAKEFAEIFKETSEKVKQGDDGVLNFLASVVSSPVQLITMLFCYLSYLGVSCVIAFFRIAHAIGFSLVYVYGLIALPLSITNNLRLLKGWGLFLGFFLLWPIVDGMVISFLSTVFSHGAETILQLQGKSAGVTAVDMNLIYTLLNIVLGCALVASPFVTGYLVANHSAHTALMAPFVAGAGAAATALFQSRQGTSSGGGRGSGSNGPPRPSIPEIWRDLRSRPVPTATATPPTQGSASPAGTALAGGGSAGPTSMTPGARQQRRGAIIAQNRKAKAKGP